LKEDDESESFYEDFQMPALRRPSDLAKFDILTIITDTPEGISFAHKLSTIFKDTFIANKHIFIYATKREQIIEDTIESFLDDSTTFQPAEVGRLPFSQHLPEKIFKEVQTKKLHASMIGYANFLISIDQQYCGQIILHLLFLLMESSRYALLFNERFADSTSTWQMVHAENAKKFAALNRTAQTFEKFRGSNRGQSFRGRGSYRGRFFSRRGFASGRGQGPAPFYQQTQQEPPQQPIPSVQAPAAVPPPAGRGGKRGS